MPISRAEYIERRGERKPVGGLKYGAARGLGKGAWTLKKLGIPGAGEAEEYWKGIEERYREPEGIGAIAPWLAEEVTSPTLPIWAYGGGTRLGAKQLMARGGMGGLFGGIYSKGDPTETATAAGAFAFAPPAISGMGRLGKSIFKRLRARKLAGKIGGETAEDVLEKTTTKEGIAGEADEILGMQPEVETTVVPEVTKGRIPKVKKLKKKFMRKTYPKAWTTTPVDRRKLAKELKYLGQRGVEPTITEPAYRPAGIIHRSARESAEVFMTSPKTIGAYAAEPEAHNVAIHELYKRTLRRQELKAARTLPTRAKTKGEQIKAFKQRFKIEQRVEKKGKLEEFYRKRGFEVVGWKKGKPILKKRKVQKIPPFTEEQSKFYWDTLEELEKKAEFGEEVEIIPDDWIGW